MSLCPPLGELRRVICESLGDDTLAAIDEHVRECRECKDNLAKLEQDLRWASSRRMDPLPEEGSFPRIEGFEIERELGRGGMGVVYLARKETLRSRPVALKVVPRAPGLSNAERPKWRDEAQALSLVRHLHVVTLYDAGETSAWRFLVLEYVSGGSLEQRPRGPLPPRTAATLLTKIADGVAAIHQAGLVHLDLKPANILLDGEPATPLDRANPRVTDLGIARLLADPALVGDDPRTTNLRAGTPSYMAPEQVRADRPRIGPATDIHALGTILYELLTGRPPFEGPSPTETMAQILDQDPVPPRRLIPKLPRDLETIVLKCLEKDPSRRYASAKALADDLRCWLGGHPITTRPVCRQERAWRWCRRRPAVAALAAGLMLALGGGFLGMFLLWRHAESERGRTEFQRARAEFQRGQAQAAQVQAETNSRRAAELLAQLVALNVGGPDLTPKVMRPEETISLLQLARRNILELIDRMPDRQAMLMQLYRVSGRLGRILVEEHRWDEARRLYESSVQQATLAIRSLPRAGVLREWLVTSLLLLAEIADRKHNPGEAEALLRRAVLHAEEWSRDVPGTESLLPSIRARRQLARVLAGQGRHAEAGPWLLANDRALKEAPRDRLHEAIEMERIRSFLAFQCCGLVPPADSRAEEVGPPDPLSLLTSPQGDRLPPEAWAKLVLRVLRAGGRSSSEISCESQAALSFAKGLTEVASAQRQFQRFAQARQTADRLAAMGKLLVKRYPSDHIAFLVLAEAYWQEGQNAWWPVEDRPTIERARWQAVAANQQALELAPYDAIARHELERREQKLDDYLKSR